MDDEKRDKKGTRIDHMTERKVLQRFIAKLNESMKLFESEQSSTSFGKNLPIIGSEIWYMFDFS